MEGRVSQPRCVDDKAMRELEESNPEAAASIQRMLELGARRPPEQDEPANTSSKIIQFTLPGWPDAKRGAPNTLLRSALFAAIHSKKRRRLGIQPKPHKEPEGILIAAQDGIHIKYAGTQLNQYDADVFFEALHRARGHALPTECIFTGYNFLKAIGRSNAPGNYEDLDESLRRLRDGRVEIDWKAPSGKKWHYEGGLIAGFKREETTKLYKVTFTRDILALFAPACWTQLEWEERMALKGKPLAQWLHNFYCSHAPAFPLSFQYLHEKSGSQRTVLRNFRIDLKNALATLEKKLHWKAGWEGDVLTVKRQPSASQIRHLNQKTARRKGKQPQHRRGRTEPTPLFDFLEFTGR
jgi:TrfA protein